MTDPKTVLRNVARYFRDRPDLAWRVVRNAAALKVTVPLDAARALLARFDERKAGAGPADIALGAESPALRLAASLHLMGTPLRASAVVRITSCDLGDASVRVALRLSDVTLRLEKDSDSPLAALIKSGALDLSKPGELVRYMPNRPPALAEAAGDRLVLELMKVPQLAQNERAKRVVKTLASLVALRSVDAEDDALVFGLSPLPHGAAAAWQALRPQGFLSTRRINVLDFGCVAANVALPNACGHTGQ